MAAIVCVSLISNNSIPIMVQSQMDSKPLNLCKQQPSNNPDDPQRVKQTLKTLIQSRRLAEGKDAITIDFDKRQSDDDLKLTPEELARQKDRKEQNRRAAQKCRQKKRHQLQTLLEEEEELLVRRGHLEAKYQKLNSEKEKLLNTIRSNGQYTCQPSDSRTETSGKEDDKNSQSARVAEDNAGHVVWSLLNKTTKNPKHYYIQKYQKDQLSETASDKSRYDSGQISASDSDSQSSCSTAFSTSSTASGAKQELNACGYSRHSLPISGGERKSDDDNSPGQTSPVDFSRKNLSSLIKGCVLESKNRDSLQGLEDNTLDSSQEKTLSNVSDMEVSNTYNSHELSSSQELFSSQELSSSQSDLPSSQESTNSYYRHQKSFIDIGECGEDFEDNSDEEDILIIDETDSPSEFKQKSFSSQIFNSIKVTCT
ncbi:uncharacterized protein LOC132549078 [Ylistrum balloti]|uniref:uncharacterized protein LOC132549078 n=1 Tax=Ylistrum balloti TaxID=509963 RepID=UPI002905C66F|nr:uncharacterized protein LOC132549078 [Ylistrum balloti]